LFEGVYKSVALVGGISRVRIKPSLDSLVDVEATGNSCDVHCVAFQRLYNEVE